MRRRPFHFTGLVLGVILSASLAVQPVLSSSLPFEDAGSRLMPTRNAGTQLTRSHSRFAASLSQLPLYFVENRGQFDSQVTYYVLGGGTEVYFTKDGLTLVLSRTADYPESLLSLVGRPLAPEGDRPSTSQQRWVVKLDFVGANHEVRPVGQQPTEAKVSYFKGARYAWRTGLATFAQVVYPDLWPGIDLVYYGQAGALKYEFRVKPGADPRLIRLAYRGANSLSLNANGQLAAGTPFGDLVDEAPVAWQDINGQRVPVHTAYTLSGAEYTFRVGSYDQTKALVLDPALLVYAGYIGGSGTDVGNAVAVDIGGNVYITGWTTATEATFPVKIGPDLTWNGESDAFVAKVSADGTTLLYVGYIGGSKTEFGNGIAVDSAGNAYVAGSTQSMAATFPVMNGPGLTYEGGASDGFVAKINPAGTALLYAGYIGGSNWDSAYGIAVDSAGNAYVTGSTSSTQDTFPVTVGPDLTYNGDPYDAFAAKVSASGTALLYAGYIGGGGGGSGRDDGYGIAVDSAGNAYVTGSTGSTATTFPVIVGPDLIYNGTGDAFVAKVNAAGSALLYAGYIGGSGVDLGYGIAVDSAGNAYVTGETQSTEATFPVKAGPDLTHNGGKDIFVAKVNPAGTALAYAGFIGGSSEDIGRGIAVDTTGNAYVTGETQSTEATFPVKAGPGLTFTGGKDVFVAKVSTAGNALLYAGYIGGSSDDSGFGIAVDGTGNAYVTGSTASTEATFPVSMGPDPTYNGGTADAFVAKVHLIYQSFLPLAMRPLPPPNLDPISPPGDQPSYSVNWSAVDGASSYSLEESIRAEFNTTQEVYRGPDTSHTIESHGIQRYFYRVRAIASLRSGEWSTPRSVDVRWELEANDYYYQATGPMLSGIAYYGFLRNGEMRDPANYPDGYWDYFKFDSNGGRIELGLALPLGQPAGAQNVLAVYYGQPQQGGASCYLDKAPYACVIDKGKPGTYYVQIFSQYSVDGRYSLQAAFP